MDPITGAMIASQVISGLAQAYTSAKANGANQDLLNRIQSQYDALMPPNFNMSITAPPALQQQALASPQFQQAVASPAYDMTKLQPQNLQSVGQMVPQLAPLIREVASTTINGQSSDQVAGRNAQLQALQKFAQVGAGGFDPQYQQKVQQAAQAAQTEAQGRQGALMDSFARRGISGSGLELAANMAGNAQTMNSLGAQNQAAAANSYQNQLQALAQGAGIGSNLQNQDTSLQAQNAAIINAFNQRMAQSGQNVANNNAQTMNSAQAANLANQQNIANQNVMNANNMATQQQGRGDMIAGQQYNAALQNAQMNNQNMQNTYQNNVGQQNAINANNQYLANFQRQGVNDQNNLQTSIYNNQINKLNGQSGLANAQMGQNTNRAQSTNAGISSLGNLASIGAYMYGKAPAAKPTNDYGPGSKNPSTTNVWDYNTPMGMS